MNVIRSRSRSLIAAVVTSVVSVLAGCGSSAEQPAGPRITPITAIPTANTRPATGSPAIHPASPAGVTLAEVRAYVSSHLVAHSLTASNPTVERVGMVSAAQLSQALAGEPFGVPDQTRLAVAVVSGQIVFPGPPGGGDFTYHLAIEVFDAKNGNLLATGGLLQPLRILG